jgi:hypothetical protein
MKHLLYPGQVFRIMPEAKVNLIYAFNSELRDYSRVHLRSGASYEGITTLAGEERDIRYKGAAEEDRWSVSEVKLTGGGTAHGPHDVYPDGHHVKAENQKGMTLEFYQSGCFTGVIEPECLELLNEDTHPDAPKKWQMAFST